VGISLLCYVRILTVLGVLCVVPFTVGPNGVCIPGRKDADVLATVTLGTLVVTTVRILACS